MSNRSKAGEAITMEAWANTPGRVSSDTRPSRPLSRSTHPEAPGNKAAGVSRKRAAHRLIQTETGAAAPFFRKRSRHLGPQKEEALPPDSPEEATASIPQKNYHPDSHGNRNESLGSDALQPSTTLDRKHDKQNRAIPIPP